eukprot:CAMPEP_0179084038 /NCGR_PEP_ID=MMETSP0796-20121207/37982_1 /TAXON_ID=73915 /ORGANISM="Pyrodinium bahamense, Strain pbaha01" /LENGTH=182 /DNA_ID=CAMNT_0020781453 /DNA_START=67 /DNA_END=615 /DNA_ORIENTATION=+
MWQPAGTPLQEHVLLPDIAEAGLPSQDATEGAQRPVHRVRFRGITAEAFDGELLRSALLRRQLSPHNGNSKLINCRGLGTCGTCAVSISGPVEPVVWTAMEQFRLQLPPHRAPQSQQLRLACQCVVRGDLELQKFDGFWGEGTEPSEESPADFCIYLGELEYVMDGACRQSEEGRPVGKTGG